MSRLPILDSPFLISLTLFQPTLSTFPPFSILLSSFALQSHFIRTSFVRDRQLINFSQLAEPATSRHQMIWSRWAPIGSEVEASSYTHPWPRRLSRSTPERSVVGQPPLAAPEPWGSGVTHPIRILYTSYTHPIQLRHFAQAPFLGWIGFEQGLGLTQDLREAWR